MLDLYFRDTEPSPFAEKIFEIESDIDLFITQIQMILTTPLGSVFNQPQFGNALQDYLHEFNATAEEMKTHLAGQIRQFCPLHTEIPYSIDVTFYTGTLDDIAVVDVTVDTRKVLGLVVT